jgi:pantoate--beta-alanine ligase
MYRDSHLTYCEVQQLDQHLCGAARPGHFKGVCTVVLKLFNIIEPTVAYFGKKDFQQAAIIQRMVSDLNLNLQISRQETVRESSGLAVSSRNLKLSPEELHKASAVYRGLQKALQAFLHGEHDSELLIETASKEISASQPDKIDYLSIVSQDTLQPLARIDRPAIMAAAVFYGGTRLIDNVELVMEA